MSKGGKMFLIGFLLFAWGLGLAGSAEELPTPAAALILLSMVLMPVGIVAWLVGKIKKHKAMTPEEKQERFERWQTHVEQQKLANTIVSTAIVGGTTIGKQKSSITSSFVRGAVGGAAFGLVGMIAGAVTPKKKTVTKGGTVTFSILYASGDRTVETVKVGSKRYNELAKYIA